MILRRAFIREVLHSAGAAGAVLLAIFLPVRLVGFLRQAAEGDIAAGGVLLLLFLKTITYLDILAPLALYAGVLMVMARWIRGNELSALSACGIGVAHFLKPALLLFAVVGALDAFFALYLSPLSAQASRAVTHELRARADTAIAAGVFTESADGERVVFAGGHGGHGALENVFIYDGGLDEDVVVVAERAQIRARGDGGDEFFILQNGARYQGAAGARAHAALEFATYGMRVHQPSRARHLPLKATPTHELLAQKHFAAAAEFHWRLSKVFMLAVLLIFALAFSSTSHRRKRFPGMLPAMLVYFIYSNLLGFAFASMQRGDANPHWTLWAVHAVFLALAAALLHRRHRNLPLLPFARA